MIIRAVLQGLRVHSVGPAVQRYSTAAAAVAKTSPPAQLNDAKIPAVRQLCPLHQEKTDERDEEYSQRILKAGNIREAYSLLKDLQHRDPISMVKSYHALVESYASHGKVHLAYKLIEKLPKYGVTPRTEAYLSLIWAYSKAGQVQWAMRTAKWMIDNKVPINVEVFNAILHGFGRQRKPAEAASVIDFIADHGLSPNVETFNQLIRAYGVVGDLPSAEGVLERIQSAGMTPNATTYTYLLYAHQRHALRFPDKPELVTRALSEYQRFRGLTTLPIHAYHVMMEVTDPAGDVQAVKGMYNDMEHDKVEPTARTFALRMRTCVNAKENALSHALAVLEDMKAATVLPDDDVLLLLVKVASKEGEAYRAFDIIAEYEKDGVKYNPQPKLRRHYLRHPAARDEIKARKDRLKALEAQSEEAKARLLAIRNDKMQQRESRGKTDLSIDHFPVPGQKPWAHVPETASQPEHIVQRLQRVTLKSEAESKAESPKSADKGPAKSAKPAEKPKATEKKSDTPKAEKKVDAPKEERKAEKPKGENVKGESPKGEKGVKGVKAESAKGENPKAGDGKQKPSSSQGEKRVAVPSKEDKKDEKPRAERAQQPTPDTTQQS
eukprot:TRINITY_DN19225_c0_g1::TRINITY_DN19225_c0_g1_i1::g.2310::m.2310 TRINITY_DN19225_c0_g1::TRINITY_DN19225_c0_g1_i1::g.2310  ORF type:complete len:622 (-),score=143.14,sp/Q9LYZ9/PP362_ARATH/25.83/1e-21,sp/Q9LYZ9/PP362_ARATH/23.05/1e-13,sp/Q9LYZ9/PP362_ARATH/23.53/1e-10,sp/Q9LYZ9/PP362_ARATH/21.20/3e-08,sp/Q9LYZ9/PP362_ARATH/19.81/6e-08,sp/Q9LYZ9/PP362_ARATH/20.00/3e-06,PPR_2/PF13041.1/23,PPR_2/PF13041.1/0.0034,PPR_2/PF13041.1/0.0016,PPR_2/PF13041.1/2.8e-06,PPR_2/PF13041.1/1.6e-06,PPR_2/PF13041.1/0.0